MTAPDGKLLKIGKFARLAGTNLRTLRYYEELGLVAPASRSRGGFRYYRETDLHRLHMVRDLQELGLSLERIRELVGTRSAGEPRQKFLERVSDALAEQERLLDERQRVIADHRARIAAARTKLRQCEHCTLSPSSENNFCEPCQVDGRPLPAELSALF
jgi:DNA-binding transcriptional MerR regulator